MGARVASGITRPGATNYGGYRAPTGQSTRDDGEQDPRTSSIPGQVELEGDESTFEDAEITQSRSGSGEQAMASWALMARWYQVSGRRTGNLAICPDDSVPRLSSLISNGFLNRVG